MIFQQLRIAADGGQGRAQLVGYIGGELPPGRFSLVVRGVVQQQQQRALALADAAGAHVIVPSAGVHGGMGGVPLLQGVQHLLQHRVAVDLQ